MLGKLVKWSAATVCAAYIGYANAHRIDHALREIKYVTAETEKNFIPKEQALDLRILYQRNAAGHLETYLGFWDKDNNTRLPIYQRPQGLVLGDTAYITKNLTPQERTALCPKETPPSTLEKTTTTLKGTFQRLVDFFTPHD